MAKLGPCPDTSLFIADIIDFGGATGVWNGAAGTFTVQLAPGAACGGSGPASLPIYSILNLILNGSGTVNVTVSGTGSDVFENFTNVSVFLDGTRKVEYEGPGGLVNTCAGGPLVEVNNDSPFAACACSNIRVDVFQYDVPFDNWVFTITISIT